MRCPSHRRLHRTWPSGDSDAAGRLHQLRTQELGRWELTYYSHGQWPVDGQWIMGEQNTSIAMTDPNGAIYGVPWIIKKYPLYVSIYSSTMDPSWDILYVYICRRVTKTISHFPIQKNNNTYLQIIKESYWNHNIYIYIAKNGILKDLRSLKYI